MGLLVLARWHARKRRFSWRRITVVRQIKWRNTLARAKLLRDVFVWAYERSCQQNVAIRGQLQPPDTFRLRHRTALAEAIRCIVNSDLPATEDAVHRCLPASVAVDDRNRFVTLVLEEFKVLHSGNAVRFGLRPLQLEGWTERHRTT